MGKDRTTTVNTPWNDPRWIESGDNRWRAGLRWQQAWWRSERLGLSPGPHRASEPDRLVVSNLPLNADPLANFLTLEAAAAADDRLAQRGGGGLVNEDRLRRNLLSSQPMCFNLFGQLRHDPAALLPWVRHVAGHPVEAVTKIELEWAPPADEHFRGGSAFDAFVEYRMDDGSIGFLGVECKYAEHLPETDVPKVRDVYRTFTAASGRWVGGVVDRLDRKGLRQFWLNALLVQSLLETGEYEHGTFVVAACADDTDARAALEDVRAQLVDSNGALWQPYEMIVEFVRGHDEWRDQFIARYLDFSPIADLLPEGDRRRSSLAGDRVMALALAERVLGDGSIVHQLEEAPREGDEGVSRSLARIIEDLKHLRGLAADALERPD